jgi:hypothetical protein
VSVINQTVDLIKLEGLMEEYMKIIELSTISSDIRYCCVRLVMCTNRLFLILMALNGRDCKATQTVITTEMAYCSKAFSDLRRAITKRRKQLFKEKLK